MKTSTLLWCAAVVAACANVTTPTKDQETRLDAARALLTDDPMRALDAAESLLREAPGLRAARLVAAEGSMRLAQSGTGPTQLHYVDAAAQFEKALADGEDADQPLAVPPTVKSLAVRPAGARVNMTEYVIDVPVVTVACGTIEAARNCGATVLMKALTLPPDVADAGLSAASAPEPPTANCVMADDVGLPAYRY